MHIDKAELGWEYNKKAIQIKGSKEEVSILKEAVNKRVETPYTYNRLSLILAKSGKLKEAIIVCEKYKKIMDKRLKYRKEKGYSLDISSTERNIINRLKNLQNKLK